LSQVITNNGDVQPAPSLRITPNPATTAISIEIPYAGESNENCISIFNSVGSLVWQKNTSGVMVNIDVSSFPGGIYFVKVQNNGSVQTGKIVIQ
jgi:hypothetical protein